MRKGVKRFSKNPQRNCHKPRKSPFENLFKTVLNKPPRNCHKPRKSPLRTFSKRFSKNRFILIQK